MIYIVTLFVLIVCAVFFDFGRVNKPRLKKICYNLMLIWLICLSGFAYNVGSDIPGYMWEYAQIGHHQFKTWADMSYFDNRQPGWMLLNILCSRICSRFVLLQLVIAIFSNYVILSFIKEHTKYVFLGIILYFIGSYLNFNFNGLRQTVAIAFFLIGYDYLVKKKWIKYYLCVFCAFMFHSTAAICAIFPFFYLININYKTIIILLLSTLAFIFIALRMGGAEWISELFLENADFAGLFTDRERIVEAYFGDNAMKYEGLNVFGLIQLFLFAIPIMLTILGSFKSVIRMPIIASQLLLFYLVLYLLDFVIPVVFMRLVMYIDILYYCALSDLAIDYPKKRISPRAVFTTILLCIALFRPIKTLFSENASSGLALYKQFYPYYSVFDPQIDPVRAINFGSYREE